MSSTPGLSSNDPGSLEPIPQSGSIEVSRTFVNVGVQASHTPAHHRHHAHHQVVPNHPQQQYSTNTPYPSPPSSKSPANAQHVKVSDASSKFTYTDLGYESLHSTPKYSSVGAGGPERKDPSCSASIDEASSTCCLPEEDPDEDEDDDEDDDDSIDLSRSRDPIRRRISLTTKEHHSLNPSSNTEKSTRRASRRRSQLRRYIFKWIPASKSKRSKNQPPVELSLASDDNGELVEIKEEKLVVSTTTTTTIVNRSQLSGVPEREEWGKKIDFLLSIIGFAVDLSNVWRFPYLCYKNGGGVFLIPYTIMLLFGALPLFFMELALGQFAKSGPINVWDRICPPLKGIGYCFVLISWYVSFYYNVIIAWTTNYVIKTIISGELMPWQHCNNTFNTPSCISMDDIKSQCHREPGEDPPIINASHQLDCSKLSTRTSPTEEFFNLALLEIDKAEGFSNMGTLRPELIGCLIIGFITLYFSLFKGVKSSGKVVWVTATAPYFILTILLARGLFLPGALTGIKYYMSPRMEMLRDPNVWVDAAVQVFYSIGVGFGVHLTYASFNKFHNNCYRDCIITTSVNSLTSFYSGFVIFTYLGYMAHTMDKEIQNVASEGYGLVFQVYPEAISTLPFAKFWSILFFVMLLTLGIDSAMGGLESVITGLMDEFNLHSKIRREVFTGLVICGSFLGALINCTQGGAFTMVWFDTYSAGISLLCSAMFEALAVTYFYGIDQFCLDIESMLGHKPSLYFVYSWKYISPIFLSTIIFMSIINSESQTYYGYSFPFWATFLGWAFTLSSIIAIPVYAALWYCCIGPFKSRKVKGAANSHTSYTPGTELKPCTQQPSTELNNSTTPPPAVYV